jgi:hypothetical protein
MSERERKQQLAWVGETSASVLGELARDADPKVRAAAAQNAPEEFLRTLAGDRIAEVRAAVAANPTTPSDVLLRLASDGSKLVRFWLTSQQDRALLRVLNRDPDPFNAQTARTALNGLRLYRPVLNAPGEWMVRPIASLVRRQLARRLGARTQP